MMKTNIKMKVTPEQSRKVQEICFKNGVTWGHSAEDDIMNEDEPYLIIEKEGNLFWLSECENDDFMEAEEEEVDADLFIRTNGTCIKNKPSLGNHMKEIFTVYVLYLNSMEQMYAFESKENAEVKCFELNMEWVNKYSFNQYIKDNKITQITLETYNDYYLEVNDDAYVGIDKVVLEN